MKTIKKILKYIFRGWGGDPAPYGFSFLPPIFFDLIGWLIIAAAMYGFVRFLFK